MRIPPRAPVIFVSHQWLSFGHPDPKCIQLRRLQAMLRRVTVIESGDTNLLPSDLVDRVIDVAESAASDPDPTMKALLLGHDSIEL